MIKFFKKVFSKENRRNVGLLSYVAASCGSDDAIRLYNEAFNKSNYELNGKKVS